jgi:hypothetical protein
MRLWCQNLIRGGLGDKNQFLQKSVLFAESSSSNCSASYMTAAARIEQGSFAASKPLVLGKSALDFAAFKCRNSRSMCRCVVNGWGEAEKNGSPLLAWLGIFETLGRVSRR